MEHWRLLNRPGALDFAVARAAGAAEATVAAEAVEAALRA